MRSQSVRVADRLRGIGQPIRAGLWIVSAAALLYAATLLTRGRTDREWMSPPRPPVVTASAETVEAPTPSWVDLPAAPQEAPAVQAEAPAPEPSSVAGAPDRAGPEPVAARAAAPTGTGPSRGMKARRVARRAPVRRIREPIQFRLAVRPGL
jgi:hypothetical protein